MQASVKVVTMGSDVAGTISRGQEINCINVGGLAMDLWHRAHVFRGSHLD